MNEQQVRALVRSELATFFGAAELLTVDESQSPIDKVRVADADEYSDGTIESQRLENWGDVCMPMPGLDCIIWHANQGTAHIPVVGSPRRPGGFKAGDRALYCATPGTLVHLRTSDGALLLNSGTPSGQPQGDVVLNGGTLKVARDTDPVKPSPAMQAVLTAAIALINAAVPGTITPAQALELQLRIGFINGGAAHVKG